MERQSPADIRLATDQGAYIEALGFADLDGDGFLDLLAGYWANFDDNLASKCDATDTDFQCTFTQKPRSYQPVFLHNGQGSAFSASRSPRSSQPPACSWAISHHTSRVSRVKVTRSRCSSICHH